MRKKQDVYVIRYRSNISKRVLVRKIRRVVWSCPDSVSFFGTIYHAKVFTVSGQKVWVILIFGQYFGTPSRKEVRQAIRSYLHKKGKVE